MAKKVTDARPIDGKIVLRRKEQDAILRRMQIYQEYPFVCISPAALAILQNASEAVNRSLRKHIPVVLKALECYLAVTGKKLEATTTGRIRLGEIRNGFLGAIYSSRFLAAETMGRHYQAHVWAQMANSVSAEFGLAVRTLPLSWTAISPRILKAARKFDYTKLVEEQVIMWKGWPSINLNGDWSWMPLRGVFQAHGAEFAARLYLACDKYFSTRRVFILPLIAQLTKFLSHEWKPEKGNLNEPSTSSDFFNNFLLYVVASLKDSAQYSTVRDRWQGFVIFATRYLCDSKLFAMPIAGFPLLPTVERHSNIKQDQKGEWVNTKLLLDVPLQITDQEAMEILLNKLDTEISVITTWAESSAAEIWANRERRVNAAKSGTFRKYDIENEEFIGGRDLVSRSNPQFFENSAATFENFGYKPMEEDSLTRWLYPRPLCDLAYQLGLPTSGSLIPHIAILVANHTELTPSLLEKLELYDRAGHNCLIQQIGRVETFSGIKLRRVPNLAEQTIVLNEKTIAIVQQVIELTHPLREYLKSRGDSSWRLLFLSSGKGFSYPTAVKIGKLTSNASYVERMAKQISQICGISFEVAERIAHRFSLPRLRASVAVSSYIKNPDIGTLSRSLGHANVNVKLLRSYLPGALLDFFQERWIRLFQCGLLCEALQDSKWRLPATGFSSEAELDEFMMNHRLKLKPAATQPYAEEPSKVSIGETFESDSEVLFDINIEVLTVSLLLVKAKAEAVDTLTVTGRFWAMFSEHVIDSIRTSVPPREDLQALLRQAEVAAKSAVLGKGAYV